jgi:iron complex transport system permease protein
MDVFAGNSSYRRTLVPYSLIPIDGEGTDTQPESTRGRIQTYRRRRITTIILAAMLSACLVIASCFAGVANVTPARLLSTLLGSFYDGAAPLTQTEMTVLLHLRLPRITMGFLAGVGLAVSGLIMQAVTGNAMASPFTTGLSSAAAMGAAAVIVFGVRFMGNAQSAIVSGAFVMAFLCAALVYGISYAKGLGSNTIILVGIALNYFFSALNAAMQYIASEQQLSAIVSWTFGNLSQATWGQNALVGVTLAVILPFLQARAWSYNLLGGGDESASALGVDTRSLRLVSGLAITLISAAIVSFTGVIGFVGLVAPHISRLLTGGDHRALMPLSAFIGGALLVAADLAGRTIASPVVIPVGIVVSFIGVPVFIYLILRDRGVLS